MIDLRSDTVTKPTPGMLRAMTEAEVGDDVFGEDPTVNRLEAKMADMFGFEAGLFVPSGTMGNQLSVNLLTRPGDEILIEESGHVFNYESTAAAHLSSVQLRPLKGDRGKLTPEDLQDMVRGENDWDPRTRMIVVENSTNKGGGCCYSTGELKALRNFADTHDLLIHLDGARLWNAMIATGIDPEFFGTVADTLSVSFSKGLGAPVGSMLLSTRSRIRKARRMRKMWGGGMRQIGLLAAAADYAVEHHLEKLEEDHRRARELAAAIATCKQLSIDFDTVETNIVIFDLSGATAKEAVKELERHDIRMVPFGPRTLRATFHHQISDEDLAATRKVLKKLYGG